MVMCRLYGQQLIEISNNQLIIVLKYLIADMSSFHQQSIRQFVPTYVVKSDYLPTVVHEGQNPTTADLLRRYQEEKARGRVFSQRPVEFNPNRYVSFCTYENVGVDKVLNQDTFSRISRRV